MVFKRRRHCMVHDDTITDRPRGVAIVVRAKLNYSPVEKPQNLAMSGNNRFCAFLSTPDHIIQEFIGCNDYPRLAFSKFKMAAKMDAKSNYWL